MPVAKGRGMEGGIPLNGTWEGGVWAALLAAGVAGVAGSLHCVLMCGSLACLGGAGTPPGERVRAALAYQGARVLSYGAVGAGLGLLGAGLSQALAFSVRPHLPWVMAAALLASALELGKRLRPLPPLRALAHRVGLWGARFSPTGRSTALGALTPLLPCGLLYGMFAAATASGSVGVGAGLMAAFALGNGGPLLAVQLQGALWRPRSPTLAVWVRRGLPACAAAVLVVRALMDQGSAQCH